MTRRKDTSPHFIYKLLDPRGEDDVKYIGQTTDPIEQRLKEHLWERGNSDKCIWIRSLLDKGVKPIIERIETVPAGGKWWEREQYWIQWHWDNGYELVNSTAGGEGTVGLVQSEEHIEKRRQAILGKKHTPEARANMSKAKLGIKRTPETIEKNKTG